MDASHQRLVNLLLMQATADTDECHIDHQKGQQTPGQLPDKA
ncbi:MAG: hypothetical protein E6Z88_08830 [Limosilactobacillus fermentum]|nr:hypothetical protein [Limosilactobacillus fermentum]